MASHRLVRRDHSWVPVPAHHAALWAQTLAVEQRVPGGVRGGDVMDRPVLLDRLKMEYLLTQLDGICERAAKGELDDQGFLALALDNFLFNLA